MRNLNDMTMFELEKEFELYAAKNGMDKNDDYDFEEQFKQWLIDNEVA